MNPHYPASDAGGLPASPPLDVLIICRVQKLVKPLVVFWCIITETRDDEEDEEEGET